MLEVVRHRLAIALRVEHHFLGTPIPDELDVRIDREVLPGLVNGSRSRRHADGTYRFIDVPDGPHTIEIATRNDGWLLLEPTPVVVTPIGQPTVPLTIFAWPSPKQATPMGMTAVRGKLIGAPALALDRRVEIDTGSPSTSYTRTDSFAEFLFLLPGTLPLVNGVVPITVHVVGASVTGGEVVAGEDITPFTGASLQIVPGRETHVRFHVS